MNLYYLKTQCTLFTMNYKRILLLFAALPLLQSVEAQQVTLRTSLDSAAILIGNQTQIRLDLSQEQGAIVQLPYFSDTLVGGVELLGMSRPDTIQLGDNRIQIKLDYLITSFDSGLYYIPPFRVIQNRDTFYSNDLGLKVVTFEVEDTTQGAFFDIKPLYRAPFVWADYHFILLGILSALWIVVMALYAYQQHRRHGKLRFVAPPSVPQLPPHEAALLELEALKGEKLWQNGREKEYYTRITDTLRLYLERRFGFNAPEMTTSEIVNLVRTNGDLKEVRDQLNQLLHTADFVKFAKQRPLPEENESALAWALMIVSKTKPEKQEETES